ncbi:hypothetical protein D3C84_1121200 [compost metagenome]
MATDAIEHRVPFQHACDDLGEQALEVAGDAASVPAGELRIQDLASLGGCFFDCLLHSRVILELQSGHGHSPCYSVMAR